MSPSRLAVVDIETQMVSVRDQANHRVLCIQRGIGDDEYGPVGVEHFSRLPRQWLTFFDENDVAS
jgi:hypothetical protein